MLTESMIDKSSSNYPIILEKEILALLERAATISGMKWSDKTKIWGRDIIIQPQMIDVNMENV